MKLNSAQADVIPDENPVIAKLNDLFGEHTFFLDQYGLNIVEPVEAAEPAAESVRVVKLANWSNDSRSDLKLLHEPAETDIVVTLGSKH